MRINQKALGLSVIVVIFGFVFVTSALGIWRTTNSKTPAKYQSGENEGEYNPQDIKGSYTFAEISSLFRIPEEDMAAAFYITPENLSAYKCKDLESLFDSEDGKEIGTGSVRLFVALYKGLPYTLNEDTYLPASAQQVLLKIGVLTEEQKQYVESHLK